MVDGWFNICIEELSWQNPQRASNLRNRLICYGVISLQCTGTQVFIVPPPAKSHFNLNLHRTYTDIGLLCLYFNTSINTKKQTIYIILYLCLSSLLSSSAPLNLSHFAQTFLPYCMLSTLSSCFILHNSLQNFHTVLRQWMGWPVPALNTKQHVIRALCFTCVRMTKKSDRRRWQMADGNLKTLSSEMACQQLLVNQSHSVNKTKSTFKISLSTDLSK